MGMSTVVAREIKADESSFIITGHLVIVAEKSDGEIRVNDVANRIEAPSTKAAETLKKKIVDLLMLDSPVVKSARVAVAVRPYVKVNLYKLSACEARSLAKQGLVVKKAGQLYSVYEKEVYEASRATIPSGNSQAIFAPAILVNRVGPDTLVGDGEDAAKPQHLCDEYYVEKFPLSKRNDGRVEAVVEITKKPWIDEHPHNVDVIILSATEIENASFRTIDKLVEKLSREILAYPVTGARIVTRIEIEEPGDRCNGERCAPKTVSAEMIGASIRAGVKKAKKVFWCRSGDFQQVAGLVFE